MEKKYIPILGIFLLLLFLGCNTAPPEGGGETVNATVIAVADGETIVDETIEVEKGTSAFDAVQQATDIEYEEYSGLGVFITGINGVSANESQYWELAVDGEYAQVGISSITIEEDILIEFRLADLSEFGG